MTIRVDISGAGERLEELVAAAVRGEEVVLDKAGEPQVRLTPVADAAAENANRIAREREAAIGV